jgi:hypothetical protein
MPWNKINTAAATIIHFEFNQLAKLTCQNEKTKMIIAKTVVQCLHLQFILSPHLIEYKKINLLINLLVRNFQKKENLKFISILQHNL